MSENKNRLTFQDACRELHMSEKELEELVASGEIASVKEGDTLFFKPEVITQFKKSKKTEPTIILSDDEMDLLDNVEEIDLDELEMPQEEAEPVASEAAGSAGGESIDLEADLGFEELEIPELSLGEDEPSAVGADAGEAESDELTLEGPVEAEVVGADTDELAGDDTVLNLEGLLEEDSSSEATTPVPGTELGDLELDDVGDDITLEGSVSEDTILDTDVLELTDEDETFEIDDASAEELTADAAASTLLRGGGSRVMQMKRVKSHALWTILLMLGSVLMLIPMAVLINIFFYDSNEPKAPTPARAEVSQWIGEYNVLQGLIQGVADTVQDLTSG